MFDTYTEIFTERAGEYHSAMQRSPRARDAEFHAVVEPIENRADGLVCDMPAGGCYLARYLRPGLRYLGVEPVEQFLEADLGGGHRTVQAPITSVPLADGSADYVISLAGLHHEPSLPAVFEEMRRLVRRGGRVVLADVAVGTAPGRFLNGFVARHNPLGHDGRFLDEWTAGLLEAAGFEVVQDELLQVPWAFGSDQEASAFARELFGIVDLPPEAIIEALAQEIGLDREGAQIRLRWTLRRIVCDAV